MKGFLVALSLGLLLALAPARSQDDDSTAPGGVKEIPQDRLTLTVQGTARVPADQVEVELVVEAQGEDGDTAERKQRAKLRKVQRALEDLAASFRGEQPASAPPAKKKKKAKASADDDQDDDDKAEAAGEPEDATPDPKGVKVELREGRSSIGINGPRNDGTQPDASQPVTVATAVLVDLEGISKLPKAKLRRRLAKILDVALDAGADSGADGAGSRPAFRFRARDNEALRARAHEDALAKGRARAARLARMAGRELGALTSLAETGWMLRSGSTDQVGFDSVVGRIGNNKLNNYELTTSTTEIELEVELTLEFELGRPLQEKTSAEPRK